MPSIFFVLTGKHRAFPELKKCERAAVIIAGDFEMLSLSGPVVFEFKCLRKRIGGGLINVFDPYAARGAIRPRRQRRSKRHE